MISCSHWGMFEVPATDGWLEAPVVSLKDGASVQVMMSAPIKLSWVKLSGDVKL